MTRQPDWQTDDGRVRLFLGDCLEILPTLGRVDAVVTDPPYGIDYSSGHGSESWGDGSIEGDKDTAVRDAALSLVGSCSSLVFGSWRAPLPQGVRMKLIWDTLGALGMGDLSLPWKPAHQEIYVLGDRNGFCGDRTSDVISVAPVQSMAKNGRVHPFQKPVRLMLLLVKKLRAKCICDPFMGSASTSIAALRLGRQFIGIEKEPKYFDIAVKRIKAELERAPLFEPKPKYTQRALAGVSE